jgi:hypothetical protein
MNDKELADRIVALGVGEFYEDMSYAYSYALGATPFGYKEFVRDWRVAGSLMEKMSSVHVYWDDIGWSCKATERYVTGKDTGVGNVDALDRQYHDLPRAICEACVEALDG